MAIKVLLNPVLAKKATQIAQIAKLAEFFLSFLVKVATENRQLATKVPNYPWLK